MMKCHLSGFVISEVSIKLLVALCINHLSKKQLTVSKELVTLALLTKYGLYFDARMPYCECFSLSVHTTSFSVHRTVFIVSFFLFIHQETTLALCPSKHEGDLHHRHMQLKSSPCLIWRLLLLLLLSEDKSLQLSEGRELKWSLWLLLLHRKRALTSQDMKWRAQVSLHCPRQCGDSGAPASPTLVNKRKGDVRACDG